MWVNDVSTDLFEVFDVPILAGRGFVESDAAPGSNAVIIDRVFAEQVLGGGDVLGRRIRQVVRGQDAPGDSDSGPWFEIVGVVSAFTPPPPFERFEPKLYQPLALAGARDRTGRPAPGMACRGRCWRTFQRRDS
ncbi:MAG: ABC transporter permease [Longimicrobiales bacterium]